MWERRAARPRDARNEAGSLTHRLIVVYVHVSKMNNIFIRKTGSYNGSNSQLEVQAWIQVTSRNSKELFSTVF